MCYVWRHASLPPPPPFPPPPPRSVMARVTHQQFVYIRSRICRLLGTGMDFPHAVGASKNSSLKYRNIPNLPSIVLCQTLRFLCVKYYFSVVFHTFLCGEESLSSQNARRRRPRLRTGGDLEKKKKSGSLRSNPRPKRYFVSNTSDVK